MGIVKKYLKMKVVLPLLLLGVVVLAGAQQTDRPTCPNIECPDSKPEGGMFAKEDCSAEFCSCSYGVPYLLECEEPLRQGANSFSNLGRRKCGNWDSASSLPHQTPLAKG